MPALANQRHERFAQEIASGRSLTAAHASAGYRANASNAGHIRRKPCVAARIAELQAHAALRAEVSLAMLTEKLLAIAAKGEALGGAPGLAVARAALMDAAKLNGLVVERSVQAQVRVEDLLAELDRIAEP